MEPTFSNEVSLGGSPTITLALILTVFIIIIAILNNSNGKLATTLKMYHNHCQHIQSQSKQGVYLDPPAFSSMVLPAVVTQPSLSTMCRSN